MNSRSFYASLQMFRVRFYELASGLEDSFAAFGTSPVQMMGDFRREPARDARESCLSPKFSPPVKSIICDTHPPAQFVITLSHGPAISTSKSH
jgi:hypothetical protein